MTKYTKQYFIEKFEAIPEEMWCTGRYTDLDGRHCVLGHCGCVNGRIFTAEASALYDIFPNVQFTKTNDGRDLEYRQFSPKQRILAALRRHL